MAKKRVSQLAPATEVNDSDLVMIVQSGTSKKATGAMFLLPATAAIVLNLKGAAYKDVGTGANQVAAGNHGHANDSNIGGPYAPAGRDNSPVGKISFFARSTAPALYITTSGALLSRTAYPELWAEAQASGNLVSEAAWFGGQYGSYSTGNGVSTFRIPYVNGYTIRALDNGRGVDPGRVLGSSQQDAIQNITGSIGMDDATASGLSGAFTRGGTFLYDASSNVSINGYLGNFDASRVVRTAEETRVKSIALLACLKYI